MGLPARGSSLLLRRVSTDTAVAMAVSKSRRPAARAEDIDQVVSGSKRWMRERVALMALVKSTPCRSLRKKWDMEPLRLPKIIHNGLFTEFSGQDSDGMPTVLVFSE